jgi:glycosyltransferase involved in cell wall biosynthesis
MRIAHALGWYFPTSVGGTEVYVAGLARRLRAAGHEVAVIAPDIRGESAGEHEGAAVFRYPVPAHPTRDEAQGLVKVRGAERFDDWIGAWRPDILHIHSFVTGLGLFEIAAARACGARIVATHHLPSLGYVCRTGTLMQWGTTPCDGVCEPAKCAACATSVRGVPMLAAKAIGALPITLSRTLGAALPGRLGTMAGMAGSIADNQAMQRRLVELTDRMVVLNEAARGMLIANGAPAAKIILNRLGVSHETLAVKAPGATTSPVRFGFVGRLHRTKGIAELARAAEHLPRHLRFSLEFRGPEPDASERALVAAIQQTLAGDPRVSFGGPVPHADIPRVLAGFDVLCCPSTWFENGPTIALESVAAGTPVVGTRLGNLLELIQDGVNGQLVAPGDAAALARAMEAIATDPSQVDRWRAALPRVRTMNEIAVSYAALYQELMRERAVA